MEKFKVLPCAKILKLSVKLIFKISKSSNLLKKCLGGRIQNDNRINIAPTGSGQVR